MCIELRHLKVFLAVAEELSFRGAAERLRIAQPALSRTIADLEAHTGAILLERTTRVTRLTEAGKDFYKSSVDIMSSVSVAMTRAKRAHKGELGHLAVGYNDFAINGYLPSIVRRFKEQHPDVSVSLKGMTSPEMATALAEGKIDIAFLTGAKYAEGFQSLVLKEERLVCLMPTAHALAQLEQVPVAALNGIPYVEGYAEHWGSFRDPIHEFCRQHESYPLVVQEAQYSDGIIGLVEAGMGVTIYADNALLHSRRGLVVRPLKEPHPSIQSLAVWDGGLHAPRLEPFLLFVRSGIESE
ncbi:LysR family transcriptional regulator [Phyllobacterium endophyticum]|uniref:LysR family transcriptional regulator n=1 Tax=Phyllobacterium endophyticum TaxID=1149773 RepID=UPI0011CC83CE|nr:LysR substrate-binding domain-containing protein [Phyllobacterium endophyticum]TXR50384.1 LysR family transcriptional regulator [Phyllobacterium endophyticum]